MSRAPRTLRRLALLGAAACLCLPAGAGAASLGLDQRCYVAGEKATVTGSGFTPGAQVGLTQDSSALPPAGSDASGAIRSRLVVPPVAEGLEESQVELAATDGLTTARAMLNVVRAGASFTPTTGDPRTMRVRHVVSGFGLALARPSVYLHYVSPQAQRQSVKTGGQTTGRSGGSAGLAPNPPGVRSFRIGLLRGPCGVLRTSPRKLFPFRPAAGRWVLQYDTNPRYTRGAASSSFFWVRKVVTVKG